jgi:hypothetical protein
MVRAARPSCRAKAARQAAASSKGRPSLWGEQVHPAVHVQQGGLDALVQEGGDDGDRDGALAAEDQRHPPVGKDPADVHGGLAEHPEHGMEVVRPALLVVGPPPHHRQVAVVHDAHAGRGQPVQQPGATQRGGRLLLAGPVRGGAGRDAEQAELTDHRRLPRSNVNVPEGRF